MGIYVLPNANAVDVIKRVRAEMEQIQRELPAGMKGEIAYDATAYINDAIHEVVKTLIDTLLIVMVVIFLLLGSIRAVVAPVVALPISPMMSAHLLRGGHTDKGFSGVVNRTFDRFRDWYGSHLDRTLNARPAVYIFWAGVSLLAVVMFAVIPKLGTKELAPKEDQGVIFGIITAPANATIDDTIPYADAAGKGFQNLPDTRFTFQLTYPDNGFGGMVLKPWGVRKTPTKAYLPQIQAKLDAIPGIQMFPIMPPALPGADNFPVSFVITSTADQERILEFAKQIFAKAMKEHIFQFGDIDTKIDQPQSAIDFDHDKVAALGLDMQQVGADISASIGGNYVNRFNIEERSYKTIPQIKRVDRLNPG